MPRDITQQLRDFGTMMRARRIELGMTTLDVARAIGVVHASEVAAWERAAKIPTLAHALRWCRACKVRIGPEGGSDEPAGG